MAKLKFNHREYFDTDRTADDFVWPGGVGVLAIQGDQDGSTLALQASFNGVLFGALEDSAGVPITLSGLTNSDVRAIEFSAPECHLRFDSSGGGASIDYTAACTMLCNRPV